MKSDDEFFTDKEVQLFFEEVSTFFANVMRHIKCVIVIIIQLRTLQYLQAVFDSEWVEMEGLLEIFYFGGARFIEVGPEPFVG